MLFKLYMHALELEQIYKSFGYYVGTYFNTNDSIWMYYAIWIFVRLTIQLFCICLSFSMYKYTPQCFEIIFLLLGSANFVPLIRNNNFKCDRPLKSGLVCI